MWIKACLNGGRPAPAPATPAELAAEARAAVDAGAAALHIHPRDGNGRESLAAPDIAEALQAVRLAGPGTPVGVSTGIWMTGGDPARRAELIAGWTELPDFASVNASEEGFADLVRHLDARGVGVEAGVWSPADVPKLQDLPFVRILVEIIDTPADRAVTAADAILERLTTGTEILLHGEEEACWPLVRHARRLGLPTRIGLEDTLLLPDGSPAPGNAALITAARTHP